MGRISNRPPTGDIPWWSRTWTQWIQIFFVTYYITFMVFQMFFITPVLIYLLLFTRFYFVTLLYALWYVYDIETPFRGGRRWDWFRRTFGYYFIPYFPVSMVKTAEIPPDRKYLFACHPHGIAAVSQGSVFGLDGTGFTRAYPGLNISVITMRYFFLFPVQREVIMWLGACPASHESIDYILGPNGGGAGRGVAIVVGGARELLITRPKRMKLYIKHRKGFVKKALRHGASLVPVLSFGENELYDIYPKNASHRFEQWQDWAYETFFGMLVLLNGRGLFQDWFGFLPHQRPVTMVVGKPLDGPTTEPIPEPSQNQVDELHGRYMDELTRLYEEHKHHYGYGDVPLEFK